MNPSPLCNTAAYFQSPILKVATQLLLQQFQRSDLQIGDNVDSRIPTFPHLLTRVKPKTPGTIEFQGQRRRGRKEKQEMPSGIILPCFSPNSATPPPPVISLRAAFLLLRTPRIQAPLRREMCRCPEVSRAAQLGGDIAFPPYSWRISKKRVLQTSPRAAQRDC